MANWDQLGTDGNVDDRRGTSGGLGMGSSLLTVGVVMILGFFGINADPALVSQLVQLTGVGSSSKTTQSSQYQGVDSYEKFTRSVLGSTDTFWANQLKNTTITYQKPKLVLFRDATQSGCGVATTDVGPHYCPADNTIYLDETFFDVLKSQLGGSNGDVAQAYVIAHEVGHHIQNITGEMDSVQNNPAYAATGENSISVKLELQADCYAGLWARSVKDQGIFENDREIEEALSAASAVGDDRIQKETQGSVNPETWTHGSADERVASFKKGYTNTAMRVCSL
jgi:predicted metalloprotease